MFFVTALPIQPGIWRELMLAGSIFLSVLHDQKNEKSLMVSGIGKAMLQFVTKAQLG